MELKNYITEDDVPSILIEMNRFVVDGLNVQGIININEPIKVKILKSISGSASAVDGIITFKREQNKTGDVVWSGYYAGTKIISEFLFSKTFQKTALWGLTFAGGPATLGARVIIFLGTTAVTLAVSKEGDEQFREAIKWVRDEALTRADTVFSTIKTISDDGNLVDTVSATIVKDNKKGLLVKATVDDGARVLKEEVTLPLQIKETKQTNRPKGLSIYVPAWEQHKAQENADGIVDVKAHARDGKDVKAHQRSWPDGDESNNFSFGR